jgi:hypothetical protein
MYVVDPGMLLGNADPAPVSYVKRTIAFGVSKSEKKAAGRMVPHLVYEILAPSLRLALLDCGLEANGLVVAHLASTSRRLLPIVLFGRDQ